MKRNRITALVLLFAAISSGKLSAAQGQPSGDVRVFSAGQLLTNESIVRLVKADISQDTILHIVNTQPGAYALGVDNIIALEEAGISDEILNAMLEHSTHGCAPAMTVPMEILAAPPATGNSAGQPQSQPGGTSGGPQSHASTKSTGQTSANGTAQGTQALVYHYSAGAKKGSQNPQH